MSPLELINQSVYITAFHMYHPRDGMAIIIDLDSLEVDLETYLVFFKNTLYKQQIGLDQATLQSQEVAGIIDLVQVVAVGARPAGLQRDPGILIKAVEVAIQ